MPTPKRALSPNMRRFSAFPQADRRATAPPEQSSRALIRHRVGGDVGLHEWWLAPGGHRRFGPRQDHLPADRHLDQQSGSQRGQRRRRSAAAWLLSRASADCTVDVRHTRAPRARTASPKTPLDRLLRRAGRAPPSTAPLPSSSDGTPWTLGRACRRSTHPDGSAAEIAMSI